MKRFLFGFAVGAIISGTAGAILHLRSQPVRYTQSEIDWCRNALHARAFAPDEVRKQMLSDEETIPSERLKWRIIRAIAQVGLY